MNCTEKVFNELNLHRYNSLNVSFSGAIQLSPHYGNQLGGAPIMVSGTDVKFGEGDDITCIFDDQEVKGVYVNEERALCVSPQLSQTGTVLFQLQIVQEEPGSFFFRGEANYISCMSLKDINKTCINHLSSSSLQCLMRKHLKFLWKVKSLSLKPGALSQSTGLHRAYSPLQIHKATELI